MAKNPLPSAGDDVGSIPNQETGPMCCRASPRSATTEPVYPGCSRMHREWRRKWQPTPVFLPGESQGQRSLVGCCLWGRTESDTTEAT